MEYGKYSNDLYELQVGDVARLRFSGFNFSEPGGGRSGASPLSFSPPPTHAGEPLGMEAAEG